MLSIEPYRAERREGLFRQTVRPVQEVVTNQTILLRGTRFALVQDGCSETTLALFSFVGGNPMPRAMFDSVSRALERLAHWTTVWVGSSWALIFALAITIGWLV